jgi:plastocyanin
MAKPRKNRSAHRGVPPRMHPVLRPALIATAMLLVSAAVVVAAGCGGGDGGSSEGGSTTVAGLEANDHGTMDVSGKDEAKLELDDDYFEPTVLKGTPGQKLKLELENEGGSEHNLTSTDLSIDQDVEPGESAEVDITFPDSGTVSFFCKYHKSSGMAGAFESSS